MLIHSIPYSSLSVELKAVTWGKDSHGLFDYEYSQYIMKKFQIIEGVKIYRINDDVIADHETEDQIIPDESRANSEFLLAIRKKSESGTSFE